MKAYYHLPGLFEFYELYKEFLPLYRKHREYFYDWCDIGSIYGAPADCIWGGGRVGFGEHDPKEVLKLMQEYGISARLTFSNSLLTKEHLSDKKCNELCRIFDIGRDNERSRGFGNDNDISGINKRIKVKECRNGIIIYSDLLLDYVKENYPDFYFVSSTTKVLTDFGEFEKELNKEDFRYVVPDFRLNKSFDNLKALSQHQKDKVEFCAMSAAGLAARIGRNATRRLAAKIWARIARSIIALHLMQGRDISFRRRWKIRDLSE